MCWRRLPRGNYSMVAEQLLTKNPEEVHTYLLSWSLARLYPFKIIVFYDKCYLCKTTKDIHTILYDSKDIINKISHFCPALG